MLTETTRPARDLIDELLLGMRLFGVQYRRSTIGNTSGLGFSNAPGRSQFHFVAHGPVWLRAPSGALQELDTGDAVLLPHGGTHALLAAPNLPAAQVHPFDLAAPARGDDPVVPGALIFSCCMELDLGGMQPLIDAMPEIMLTSRLTVVSPEVCPMLDAMQRESTIERGGSAGILVRLAEVVAALIVRDWAATGCGDASGWVGALHDPRLSRAIVMMHRHPGRAWTVASLAKEAGNSRSVFARRFLIATGVSPLRYLTELRMRLAAHLLGRARQPLESVSSQLGYGSLAAFSRAFKRATGSSPGALRAQGKAP